MAIMQMLAKTWLVVKDICLTSARHKKVGAARPHLGAPLAIYSKEG